jgi:GT2 family glycosyltransferase
VIAAVVVTYSAPPEVLGRCLAALTGAGGADRVLVVDTGGAAAAEHRLVEVIRTDNRGYGAAANVGFDRARALGADAIALLNDDVVVRPGWLAPLVAELGAGVGAAQPVLITDDVVNSAGVAIGPDGAGIDLGRGGPVPAGGPYEIELFTGGAVVFAREFLDATGGFDERYFLYYEDVDLGRRGARLGWRYRLVPASLVEHAGGVSTGAEPDRTRYLQERNRLWVAFRYGDLATVGRALWLSVRRLRHRPRGLHARALAAGLGGAPRRLWERAAQRP